MNRSFAALWLVAAMHSAPVVSAQTIPVRVYNRAHVPAGKLNLALLETTRLFAQRGLRIAWQFDMNAPEDGGTDMSNYPARLTDRRGYVVVSIITGLPRTAIPGALGFSLPFAHTGAHVSILYDRVETIAGIESTAEYIVLGHAIAHELGHVLLRSNTHSPGGLMQANWNRATWKLASNGLLSFLPEELEEIRRSALEQRESQEIRASADAPLR